MRIVAYVGVGMALGLWASQGIAEDKTALPPVEYQTDAKCPFSAWFGPQPENTGVWQTNLIQQFEDAWSKANKPKGGELNDQKYSTLLRK